MMGTRTARWTNWRLELSFRSQLFPRRRHFSSQARRFRVDAGCRSSRIYTSRVWSERLRQRSLWFIDNVQVVQVAIGTEPHRITDLPLSSTTEKTTSPDRLMKDGKIVTARAHRSGSVRPRDRGGQNASATP